MKIDAASSIYSVDMYKAQVARTTGQRPAVQSGDEVSLSKDAVQFAETFAAVKNALKSQLDAPSPMTEAVRAQVRGGTYSVDADEVASSILLFT